MRVFINKYDPINKSSKYKSRMERGGGKRGRGKKRKKQGRKEIGAINIYADLGFLTRQAGNIFLMYCYSGEF